MRDLDREAIRRANRLEELIPATTGHPVSGTGRERRTRCHRSGHVDEHPSLRINVEKQRWYCDPCQQGGDVFDFVEEVKGISFPEALELLAKRAGRPTEGAGHPTPGSTTTGGGGGSAPGSALEHSNTPPGLTLAAYADAKGLPESFLRDLGVTDIAYGGQPATRTPFYDEQGEEQAVQFRLRLDKGAHSDQRFKWRKGSKPCPYGLWKLEDARASGRITLVEGPSDTQTLWFHDIPALGLPSANAALEEFDPLLSGIERIDVVIEPDMGGDTLLAALPRASFRERVRLISLGDANDASGLYLQDRDRFLEYWQSATGAAPSWSDVYAEERSEQAVVNFRLARDLLDDPRLMERIGETIAARGYAGDVRPAMNAYVALTSRILPDPANLAFVAASGAGKNKAVDSAKALMPPEAFHEIRAGSERSLIYDDVEFTHKTVIFSEADSIPDDGPAASAIRSLATDNILAYDTVEKVNGRLTTLHIRKLGPTGLITTSTKRLLEQLSTRTLEIPIPDDAEQTRAVLRAQAAASSARVRECDVEPFIALQRWLADAGLSDVTIPFAGVLAEVLPAGAVRMRRDFQQLLTCIKAVALLHQRQRESQDGRTVACIEDYAVSRDLLAPIFDAVAAEGCTPAVRQTVEAVGEDETVTASELAKRLGLAKSTISARTTRAVAGGWLVNEELRRGHAARFRRGAPLPERASALPTPARVRELFECSDHSKDVAIPSPQDFQEF